MGMKLKHLLNTLQSTKSLRFCSSSSAPEIDIPKRIPRSSTDILKAISCTHARDLTAPQYKYHDDPYLIPYSNFAKRSYALSQEAGRKAAQWIRQEHADLFQHKVAEPMIEAYVPKPVYNEESDVNEQVLLNLIDSGSVSDAVTVYKILTQKGLDVSASTKQSLLELLCFFNCVDSISEDWIEERWFNSPEREEKFSKNNWRPNDTVDELFNELKDTNPASYSALICGMVKYGDIERARTVYEEARNKGIQLNAEVFNGLIMTNHSGRDNFEKTWDETKVLLTEMRHRKISPNVGTLNAIMELLSNMQWHNSKVYALQTLAEFRKLNVEPSLATFYYLLEIYSKDRKKLSSIFNEVLNYLEERSALTIKSVKDVLFFAKAMELCNSKLHDMQLAYRLHNLLLKDDNYNFIGNSYKESHYYRYFFFLIINSESLDKVMEIYDNYVPSIYNPEPAVINAILKLIDTNQRWDLLPKMWSDINLFEQSEVTSLVENIASIAANSTNENLKASMCKIVWDIWTLIDESKRQRPKLQWTGSLLGNIILTLLKGNENAKAHLAMDRLVRLGSTLMNEPRIESMEAYINCCIQDNNPQLAIRVIQYCDDIGFMETANFARAVNSSLSLSIKDYEKLVSIVGEEALKTSTTDKTVPTQQGGN